MEKNENFPRKACLPKSSSGSQLIPRGLIVLCFSEMISDLPSESLMLSGIRHS